MCHFNDDPLPSELRQRTTDEPSKQWEELRKEIAVKIDAYRQGYSLAGDRADVVAAHDSRAKTGSGQLIERMNLAQYAIYHDGRRCPLCKAWLDPLETCGCADAPKDETPTQKAVREVKAQHGKTLGVLGGLNE